MLRVEVVKRVDDAGASWHYEENPVLREIIEWAIHDSLEDFIYGLLVKTCQMTGRDEKEACNFYVRVVYNNEPKFGSCFHRNREMETAILPDILAGFANDVTDFGETIVHEALHALSWDEEIIEKKAKEIYNAFEGVQQCR